MKSIYFCGALGALCLCIFFPSPLRADCSELRVLAAERAKALFLVSNAIKDLRGQIRDTPKGAERDSLISDRRALKDQHELIVARIEDSGRRIKEECGTDG